MPNNCLVEARQRAEKIQYFYDHAGPAGYDQALYFYGELGKCYSKCAEKDPSLARVIHELYLEAGKKMAEMKRRKEEYFGDNSSPDH